MAMVVKGVFCLSMIVLAALPLFNRLCCTAQEARILVAPEPVNAGLNTIAVFHCTATGEVFEWFVNGHGQDTPHAKACGVEVNSVDTDGIINSTLTIPATMDNDNITISCRAFGDNGADRSPEVLLRVQGLLDSVPNLAIDRADDYNHILTWDPPFTLDITDVNPDIVAYTVCDNVTRSCQNTSDTHYVFPILCDPVEITVSASNPVGEGERVTIVHEPPDYVRRSTAITYLEGEVLFKSLSEPVVTLLLQVDGNCFDMFNTEFRGQYSVVREFENVMPTVDENGTATLTFSENIMADGFYTVTVTVVQEPETEEMSEFQQITQETNLTTFDVQEVNVRSGDRTINVTCAFARGSQAQGCFIVIFGSPPHSPSNEAKAMRVKLANGELEGEASKSFTDLEAGTYNVLIYDAGVNGTFDLDKSLYNEQFEVMNLSQIVEPVPTITTTSASPAPSSNSSVPSPSSVDDAISIYYYVVVSIVVVVFLVVVLVVVVVVLVFIVYRKQGKDSRSMQEESGQRHKQDNASTTVISSKPTHLNAEIHQEPVETKGLGGIRRRKQQTNY